MTGSTFTTLLLLAFTAAVSPFSLIAFSLVLATERGPRNGIAFICGWVTTVMLIGVVETMIGSSVEVTESNSAGRWVMWLQLVIGILLITLWARRRFRPRPKPAAVASEPKPPPAWQRKLGTMGYGGAFVAGGAVQTWPVMIAAGAAIVRLDLGPAVSLLWMLAFALVTTAGIVALEVLAWRSPGSAVERLDRLRHYIDNHRDSVINWAALIGGLWLTFRSLVVLV